MSSNTEGLSSVPSRWWNSLTRALRRRSVRHLIAQWMVFATIVAVASVTLVGLLAADRLNKGSGHQGISPLPTATPLRTDAPSDGTFDPLHAGVPKDLYLKPVFHDLKITRDGTVVDGLDVHGRIIIKANNVTIRNTMIRGADDGSRNGLIDMTRDYTGLVVTDSEIYAAVESYWVNGIIGDHFTLRRVNIHNVIDQVQIIGDDVTIEDSWFHDNLHYDQDPNQGGTPSHDDSVEMFVGSNVHIKNNLFSDVYNANLQLSEVRGDISNVTLEGNQLHNGFCTVNLAQKGRGPMQNIVIKDNTLGKDTRHELCPVIRADTTVPIMENNVYEDGTPVTTWVRG